MSFRTDNLRTAGKITVYTAIVGVLVFAVVFIFNLGTKDLQHADAASNATTSVTVLNTPPNWTASSTELIESSQTTPTNAGDTISWTAVGTDANAERYYLLICEASNAPSSTSNAAPHCNGGVQWAVSASTTSGELATAATTTLHSWSESNTWYAWICDGNSTTPRCNSAYTQGTNATNSSPFEINHRPQFTSFWDDSPTLPGQVVIFTSTSSDEDSSGTQDYVKLFVCATAGFSTTTDTCTGTTLASTSAFVAANATATYTVVIPTQDQSYGAFGYVIDSHGFEATTTQGSDSTLEVQNAAPTVSGALVSLAQPGTTTDMILTTEIGQTTGFVLSFTTVDNNSCDSVASTTLLGDEVTDYNLSIYRNGSGLVNSSSTTCPIGGPYNPNRCYTSSVATTTWNLSCTASTTSCTGNTDTDMVWNCTFPLWYVADPTDGTATSTQYSTNDWRAQVQAIDDNLATGALAESTVGIDVKSFLAFSLNTLSIQYGALEPGQQSDPLDATTTIAATGNVGLDKDVYGQSMCTTYTNSNLCPTSATSTIDEYNQVFATSTAQYIDAFNAGNTLSSTTPKEVEINVPKSTATSSQATANAYWGIKVPITITYAGDYTGENTFTAKVGESANW